MKCKDMAKKCGIKKLKIVFYEHSGTLSEIGDNLKALKQKKNLECFKVPNICKCFKVPNICMIADRYLRVLLYRTSRKTGSVVD